MTTIEIFENLSKGEVFKLHETGNEEVQTWFVFLLSIYFEFGLGPLIDLFPCILLGGA